MRLVFCGTPQFAVPALEAVVNAGHAMELVLSQPDRPSGRAMEVQFSPVKQFALDHRLAIEQPEKIRNNIELQQRLDHIAPDAIIIVAYGRLIPPWMLTLPRYGNLNVHASLLPKYRGAAPIQWAVANGETETGVTTMRIDEGLDTGNILLEERVPILHGMTSVELSPILSTMGADLIVRTLSELAAGTLHARPQDHSSATFAPILTREDGRVDWSRSATQIYNRWRGFQPWPGAFTSFRGKKLTLQTMCIADDLHRQPAPPGMLLHEEDGLLVACGDGTWLELLELQLEGRRRMPAGAFLNGSQLAAGERLV